MPDFTIVTEYGGELVSQAQLERFFQRYIWAGGFCEGKDVLEIACGTGPGLGYLASRGRSLVAGDISPELLSRARAHYGERIRLMQFDAMKTPFASGSFDAIILFEAIYYLPDALKFFREAGRLLREGGVLLIATANKDLPGFNPSPYSLRYFNPPELKAVLREQGFQSQFFGGSPVARNLRSRIVSLVKRVAVALHLIPRSMEGKRFLKRLVFGRLVPMPQEIDVRSSAYVPPVAVNPDRPDTCHQVLYCVAKKVVS